MRTKTNFWLLLIFGSFMPNLLPACTVFTASNGKTVLVGNNEDSSPSLKSFLWYHQAQGRKHGFVTWGAHKRFPEGGMNEKGLFWDAAALMQVIPTIRDNKKPDFKGYFVDKALSECATVDQVIQLVQRYNLVWQDRAQVLVADASGDYALIHANYIIRKSDLMKPYVAVANFSLLGYKPGQSACYRYNTADNLLNQAPVSAELFRSILQKAAQKSPDNATIYSQIADLKACTFQLFQKHNFDQMVTIDLSKELRKGSHQVEIKHLFNVGIGDYLKPLIDKRGINNTISRYHVLKKTAQKKYDFSEGELDDLGYYLLNQNRINEGIQILNLNYRTFPTSDKALASLASAYLVAHNNIKADSLYRKALEQNTSNYVANVFASQKDGILCFRFNGLEYAGKINLVGSFNNWNTTANPFEKNSAGEWVCQIKVNPGTYQYTFLVGDDNWMTDPFNKLAQKEGKLWRSVVVVR